MPRNRCPLSKLSSVDNMHFSKLSELCELKIISVFGIDQADVTLLELMVVSIMGMKSNSDDRNQ